MTTIVTLGRTQPPHKAHINMLVKAFLNLKEGDRLLHLIGSTNVDMQSNGKNLLSFEEREDIFIQCLLDALGAAGHPLTREALLVQFRCLPTPDFSDSTARFPTAEMQQARATAINQAKALFKQDEKSDILTYKHLPAHSSWKSVLKDEVEQELFEFIEKRKTALANNDATKLTDTGVWGEYYLKDADNRHLPKKGTGRPLYGHGLNYIAWGFNTLDLIKNNCAPEPQGAVLVVYEVCGKDAGTQEYIDLLEFLADKYKDQLGFEFKVRLTPKEINGENLINATAIRRELLMMAEKGLSLEEVKQQAKDKSSTLSNLPDYSLEVTYKKIGELRQLESQREAAMLDLVQKKIAFDALKAAIPPLFADLSEPTLKNLYSKAEQKAATLEQQVRLKEELHTGRNNAVDPSELNKI